MKRAMLLGLVGALLALPLSGHEKSLSVKLGEAQPGDHIHVTGAGITGKNAKIKLSLEGALNVYPLVEVQGNAHGEFQVEVAIPAEVVPGSYMVKAEAGITTAYAPLKIVAGAAPAADEHWTPQAHEHGPRHATASAGAEANMHTALKPLLLSHTRRPSETVTIWSLIAAALLLCGLLWFKS
jgi:hypothetical protein